jgi:hypothetical protein
VWFKQMGSLPMLEQGSITSDAAQQIPAARVTLQGEGEPIKLRYSKKGEDKSEWPGWCKQELPKGVSA